MLMLNVGHERRNRMKRSFIVVMLLCVALFPVLAKTKRARPKPEKLTMTLAWVADAGEPKQYVFVINGVVAYKTLDGLKKYLKDIPKDSTLTWAPGCRQGGPLLSSKDEMKKFKDFCKLQGIKFTLVPSG